MKQPVDDAREQMDYPVSGPPASVAAGRRPPPTILVAVGVFVVAAGLVLIAIAWGTTAGTTNPALQMPYVISAGLTGLALVGIGLLLTTHVVRWRDADEMR